MSKSPNKLICTLLSSAKSIERMAEKENFSAFLSTDSWIMRDAVARRFLIIASISEMLLEKYEAVCMRYPEIPFSAMSGMKPYLAKVHDLDIDWAIVWQTIQEEIPGLIEQLVDMLRELRAAN